jgi:HNH endonuclease
MQSIEERFLSHVQKHPFHCWLWTGPTHGNGYGEFMFHRKRYSAHRFSFRLYNGTIRKGLHVLHRCDNPPCVRPSHLFLGTPADNWRDMIAKGHHARVPDSFKARLGTDNNAHKLTNAQVKKIRKLYESERHLPRKGRPHSSSILATMFHVDRHTIRRITTRRYWKHIA